MPEEKAAEAGAAKPSKKLFGLIVAAIVLMAAAAGGLVIYKVVVAPMFEEPEAPPADQATDAIPSTAVACDFDEAQAAVRSDDPTAPNSVLMYAVSFICANPQTQLLVEKNKQWFVSKLAELHRNRTKTEFNDPQVEKEITRLALEEANSLLRRLQEKPDPSIRVIEVLHLKFSVFDL
jgi:flagellar basal body-associated protein FliL